MGNRVPEIEELTSFFREQRMKAICFLTKRYSISDDDAEDIYQDSSMALFSNIKNGKLESLTSTLSTYFFQICCHQANNHLRKRLHIATDYDFEIRQKDEYAEDKINVLLGIGDSGITDEQKQLMRDIVQQLPKPCDDILWYYYGDNLDMKAIADILDYKNANTVKTTKSRCMSKLKAKFDQIKEEFYG